MVPRGWGDLIKCKMKSIFDFSIFCALTLADFGSCRSIILFACAAGGQEASGAGLLSITAPRGRGRDSSPRFQQAETGWTSTPSAMCAPRRFCTFDQFRLVQRRMEQVPSRLSLLNLQGPHQDSQFGNMEIRSTTKMKRNVSDLYSMKVHSVNVRAGSNTYAQHLHLDFA